MATHEIELEALLVSATAETAAAIADALERHAAVSDVIASRNRSTGYLEISAEVEAPDLDTARTLLIEAVGRTVVAAGAATSWRPLEAGEAVIA